MKGSPDLDFVHVYEPPKTSSAGTLLMLHGTGGNEHDLLPIGQMIASGAGMLSPRGKVLENGMPRFFRRLAEGVFDEADLQRRAVELADFVVAAAARYGFDPAHLAAVGYSNGANIASALMLLRPSVLPRAVLFRGMVPLVPATLPSLKAHVLISNGRVDPIVSEQETKRLAALLRGAGADVEVALQPAGHQLIEADIAAARDWLRSSTIMSG